VTLIKPASIGTPMPQHVKNYTAQEPKFPPPVYAPEEVARPSSAPPNIRCATPFVGGGAGR
jgi:hypothetical protein